MEYNAKSLNERSEQELIQLYLGLLTAIDNRTNVFTSFVAAIRDARKFTRRDQGTGQLLPDEQENQGDPGSWLGAVGYLILLDQIGKALKPKGSSNALKNPSIQNALKNFSDLSEADIDAVYALRNAFAHDYSLFNINRGSPSLTHHFTVQQHPTAPVVRKPFSENWDGQLKSKSFSNMTIINLFALGSLVERIYSRLLEMAKLNDLEIALPGGKEEFIGRYFLFSQTL